MKILIAVLFTIAGASPIIDIPLNRLAMQNPNLFQGDILGYEPGDKNVIPNPQARWTNKKVPYVIDASLASHRALIQSAMDDYHKNTCVRFVPRTNEKNYIRIFSGKGCYSYVGMVNRGAQDVSLGPGCLFRGTIVHELGHAIGFFHEQSRSDRDQYLTILWQNILPGMQSQFAALKPNENLLFTPFDYDSIMIYGNLAFSKDGRSFTIIAKNKQRLLDPYQKQGMTKKDIQSVKAMYKC